MTQDIEFYELYDKIGKEKKTYSNWTEEWWNWIIEIAEPEFIFSKPEVDEQKYGELLTNREVYFLAANFFKLDQTAKRSISIKKAKSDVLFPVVNQFSYTFNPTILEELKSRVNYLVNSARNLVATIHKEDGVTTKLNPVRVYTSVTVNQPKKLSTRIKMKGKDMPLFDRIDEKEGYEASTKGGQSKPYAFADGFWIFIKGLSRGEYVINTYGEMEGYENGNKKQPFFAPQARFEIDVE